MSGRSLLVVAAWSVIALAGCDSTAPLRADLGLAGDPPAIDAVLAAGAGGQTITFTAPAGGALPDDWSRAQTIRLQISGTSLPLAKLPAGLVATLPATVPFAKPLDDKPQQMTFLVDGDHVSLARVTFK